MKAITPLQGQQTIIEKFLDNILPKSKKRQKISENQKQKVQHQEQHQEILTESAEIFKCSEFFFFFFLYILKVLFKYIK